MDNETDTLLASDGTGATLLDSRRAVQASDAAPVSATSFDERYKVAELLGAGGMGEVRVCRDHTIGRDVAIKVIRRGGDGVDADLLARFLREARVQGQLEHPAIVPVYDLGVDPQGSVYFTMKRVRGMGFDAVLAGLKKGAAPIVEQYSRRRLLTAFRSVCLAVHFAHTRGVLHRDLKPSNIMLGDFGEVYVLDWGLAKVAHVEEPAPTTAVDLSAIETAMTVPGAVLGTPGYMSPEQIRAQANTLNARTDVYALGAMLFEIFALEPLHPHASVPERIVSTLTGTDARPSKRRPDLDVPPELDALCARATATEADERVSSARDLSDAIERFLDGDRNLELRRAAARSHAERAEQALVRSRDLSLDESVERSSAMREVTSALGLDPDNALARRTLVALLAEPPRVIPPEAQAELDASSQEIERTVVSWGFFAYLPYSLFVPFLLWMGILDWTACTLTGLYVAVAAAVSVIAGKMRVVPGAARAAIVVFASLGVFWSSLTFGPFMLTPMFGLSHTIAVIFAIGARHRALSIAVGALSVCGPYFATRLGWWPASYGFHDGLLTITPNSIAFPPQATVAYLLFANVLMIVLGGVLAGRFRDLLAASDTRRQLQGWQLRQAAPEEARALVQQH